MAPASATAMTANRTLSSDLLEWLTAAEHRWGEHTRSFAHVRLQGGARLEVLVLTGKCREVVSAAEDLRGAGGYHSGSTFSAARVWQAARRHTAIPTEKEISRGRRVKGPPDFRVSTMAEKFKDPVCGMTVEPAKAAAKGNYGGQTVYFCSAGCKAEYDRTHHPSG